MNILFSFEVDADIFESSLRVGTLEDDLSKIDFSECGGDVETIFVCIMSGDMNFKLRPVRRPKFTKNLSMKNMTGEFSYYGNSIEFDILIDHIIFLGGDILQIKRKVIEELARVVDTIANAIPKSGGIDPICFRRSLEGIELTL